MIADFEYYKNEFHGIIIPSEEEYNYFAERAGDELALYVNRLPNTDDAKIALKRCACRVADIIYGDFKLSKYGSQNARISSESVSGYYSVSFSTMGGTEAIRALKRQINTAITLYLGKYILGARKVMQ